MPRDAVVRNTRGAESVWTVVDEDGVTKAVPQEITTGRSYRGVIEVVDNALSEGVLVVVRGNEILRPGQSISIADELAPDL